MTLVAIDNVGNVGVNSTDWVIVDTDDPASFSLIIGRAGGAGAGDSAQYNETEGWIKFDVEADDYFNVTMNVTISDIGNSDFWKIEWDKNGVLELPENDTSGQTASKDFN